MKKLFFCVAVLAVALLSGCKKETTEITEANMDSQVKVCGHARYTVMNKDGDPTDLEAVPDSTEVTVLRGVDTDNDGTVDAYVVSSVVKTDSEGYFEANVGVAAGKSVEVKVTASFYMEDESYAYNAVDAAWVETATYLYGEKSTTTAVSAGNAVYFDLLLAASAYVSEAGLTKP